MRNSYLFQEELMTNSILLRQSVTRVRVSDYRSTPLRTLGSDKRTGSDENLTIEKIGSKARADRLPGQHETKSHEACYGTPLALLGRVSEYPCQPYQTATRFALREPEACPNSGRLGIGLTRRHRR